MIEFKDLLALAVNRKGGLKPVEAQLPAVKSAAQLRRPDDAFYFSALTRRVFRAGLKHSLVDAKWPAFEEVFFRFDPEKLVLMGGEHIERLMQNTRLIRHLGKLRSVPRNAQLVLDIRAEYGSMGNLIADWPEDDIVGLWRLLAKRGAQLGGQSAPRLLRMLGKDTWAPSEDVVAALKAQGIIDKMPSSQRDQAAAQAAFNQWSEESGRPLCQLSAMLAFTVNH